MPEDYATPALALAAARPGDHVSLADGTYGDNVSVSVNGSSAGYVVIKARNHCMAAISGHWNVTGDWIWFTGLTAARPGTDPDPNKNRAFETPSFYSWRLAGKRNRVTNCRIDSPNGIWINSDAGFRTEYVDICFNDFTGRTEPRWNQANCIYMGRFATNSAGCNNVLIARNRWYDDLAFTDATSDNAETRFCIYTGNSHPDDNNVGVNRSVRIWENYVNIRYIGRGFYTKRTYDYRRNYISVNSGGGALQSFNLRHGGYSRADGTAFTNPPLTDNTRGWIEGNNFANGKVIVNDSDHLWLGNRFAKNVEFYYGGQRWEFESATNTWRASAAEGYVQAAKRNIFVGCTFGGSLILGEDEGTSGKPYKLAADQGGAIAGVINYGAGIANQPSETNGKLVRRRDWNNGATINSFQPSDAGQLAVLAGTAGYRLDAAGNGGYAPVSYVVADDLESSTGCDPLS